MHFAYQYRIDWERVTTLEELINILKVLNEPALEPTDDRLHLIPGHLLYQEENPHLNRHLIKEIE